MRENLKEGKLFGVPLVLAGFVVVMAAIILLPAWLMHNASMTKLNSIENQVVNFQKIVSPEVAEATPAGEVMEQSPSPSPTPVATKAATPRVVPSATSEGKEGN